ncbi:MAG: hypothetical protein OEU55_15805 [Desulfobacterales bacterium]|nr:hypothetical protein [Desulfobacterales bacterium]
MAYRLEGKLLEVCTCNAICPCWVGEDPDGGALIGWALLILLNHSWSLAQ